MESLVRRAEEVQIPLQMVPPDEYQPADAPPVRPAVCLSFSTPLERNPMLKRRVMRSSFNIRLVLRGLATLEHQSASGHGWDRLGDWMCRTRGGGHHPACSSVIPWFMATHRHNRRGVARRAVFQGPEDKNPSAPPLAT